ncbi:hypothetical protein P4S93_18525 [Aneurinibacillus thermoaerophilus]|uniref:Uncharacterized protein n=1 Tax=Aneurinibacillus thermoaerophilus TaxID=143495 RepID=A0ABX8YC78_ANETH|nr:MULTISPECIES: hypothetical protein [Paenibacillaceae]AMA74299.1 hypothetical protein ACH33_16780 [Aneurinibacillus sp. XH2]MBG9795716.1 hypothetical protein [Paenibacillus dendritiformis]MED0759121.1 hypothetical protein [Aneurinibacillus thermoaerophilus]MED0762711.1 hypothetical protein [Aneurinibacillus thermoaerophilus]QYY43117.1 hypothetical protein K3F53_02050 [Aneurinibacillus thermoaerophilus]
MRRTNYAKKAMQAQERIAVCEDMIRYIRSKRMYFLAKHMTMGQFVFLLTHLDREKARNKRKLNKAAENMGGMDKIPPWIKQKSLFAYLPTYQIEPSEPQ